MAEPTTLATPTTTGDTPKVKAPKARGKKGRPHGSTTRAPGSNGTHDGSAVGYRAKCQSDCRWNATRVEFYKSLRKVGEGTAQQISKASNGKVSVGNCLHYGYHGVVPGLNRVEDREGVKGFVFVITAKGRKVDLDKVLEKKG